MLENSQTTLSLVPHHTRLLRSKASDVASVKISYVSISAVIQELRRAKSEPLLASLATTRRHKMRGKKSLRRIAASARDCREVTNDI